MPRVRQEAASRRASLSGWSIYHPVLQILRVSGREAAVALLIDTDCDDMAAPCIGSEYVIAGAVEKDG